MKKLSVKKGKRCGICGDKLNPLTPNFHKGICKKKTCFKLSFYQYRSPNGWELSKKGLELKDKLEKVEV